MGLRDELMVGDFDGEFTSRWRQVARSATASRPSPNGNASWSDDEIDDLVQDAVVKATPGAIVSKAAEAASDAEFFAWTKQVIQSTLADRVRRTPGGRLARAFKAALNEGSDEFVETNGRWKLCGDDREQLDPVDREAALDAAWFIETSTIRQDPYAERTPPLAARKDIRAVARAILEVTGPLSKADLYGLLGQRFNAATAVHHVPVPESGEDEGPALVAAHDEDEVDNRLAAEAFLSQLTTDDVRYLALVAADQTVRERAESMRVTKHQEQVMWDRAKAMLTALGSQGGASLVSQVIHLAGQRDGLGRLVEGTGRDDD